MGLFDSIVVGDRYGQVKCWYYPSLYVFGVGDYVPPMPGRDGSPQDITYSIKMDGGGFVNVKDLKIESWDDAAKYTPIFDKHGEVVQ